MRSDEEAVLALPCAPERVPIAHHVRGTVVVSSQRSLASRKLLQAYERALEPAFRDELKGVIASSWVPIDAALAHYAAADALGLDLKTMDAIGVESGKFIYSTVILVVLRVSAEIGSTPWAVLTNLNRFRERTWQGGAFEVFRLGPKEARVVWHGQPCASIPYFRYAFGAFITGVAAPLCTKAYARVLTDRCTPTRVAYRVSWA